MIELCVRASDCLLATAAPGSLTVAASAWPSFVNSFEGSSEQPPLPPSGETQMPLRLEIDELTH